ncbi:MAG TPA: DUF3034 family protein [Steroidobacteraceae bacterium]|nr:DUF3034 family protein [Steroidobacteraceae bacterium]
MQGSRVRLRRFALRDRLISIAGSLLGSLLLFATVAHADGILGADEGKLLMTGAFSDISGSAGGGLVPMALITGYGSQNSWGANAHVTDVRLHDFNLLSYGLAAAAFDRLELSYAKQQFDVVGTALDGISIRQDVFGAKLKLLGDAVYNQNSWLPQLSVGTQYMRNEGIDDADHVGHAGLVSPTQLGARSDHGWDFYAAATKVFLGQSLLVNVVGRATRANQYGLLGFGGDLRNHYSFKPEASVAYLLLQQLAVGGDFRANPHNLSVDNQRSSFDLFVAWTPTKNLSLVGAYVNLGSILAPVTQVTRTQDGPYLSLQVGL